jgi:hypothetical protein
MNRHCQWQEAFGVYVAPVLVIYMFRRPVLASDINACPYDHGTGVWMICHYTLSIAEDRVRGGIPCSVHASDDRGRLHDACFHHATATARVDVSSTVCRWRSRKMCSTAGHPKPEPTDTRKNRSMLWV